MGVAPAGNIFKALEFDGESSRSYGVYITGEAVYNAPERSVEMIEIPGRNGSFALDKGNFTNIEVRYPAGIYADNEQDFAEAVSDFRNFLCSKKGYCRLTDEYNPSEYRMAIYKSGLEVTPATLKAGEFEIVFDCKPQRWLTSGEEEVNMVDGGSITNPTLFESSPLLMAEGYGNISFNGYEIELINGLLGNIQLIDRTQKTYTTNGMTISGFSTFDTSLVEDGDTITVIGRPYSASPEAAAYALAFFNFSASYDYIDNITHSDTNTVRSSCSAGYDALGNEVITLSLYAIPATFTAGTSGTFTATSQYNFTTMNGSQTGQGALSVTLTIDYDGDNKITTTMVRQIVTDTLGVISYQNSILSKYMRMEVYADSSVRLLGDPTYVDCDLGEVYKVEGNTIVGLNRYVDLGSKLPKLSPGENGFSFDVTITDLKVVPRWWKV